jgi:hypothetical protein
LASRINKILKRGKKPNSNNLWNTSLKSRHGPFIHSEENGKKWDSDRDGPYCINYETGRIQRRYRRSSDTNRQKETITQHKFKAFTNRSIFQGTLPNEK